MSEQDKSTSARDPQTAPAEEPMTGKPAARISRREFLTVAGVAGLTIGAAPLILDACTMMEPDIVINTPTTGQFVDSFSRIPIVIRSGAGFTIDDLDFKVPGGPAGASVSLSRDVTFNPAHPDVMLLYGYHPGVYKLQALKKGTSTVLAEGSFTVTDKWTDTTLSPSRWFNGAVPSYSGSPTWGGGSSTSPQNYNTHPATGERKIAVILSDTSDQRFPSGSAFTTITDSWRQAMFDGVVGSDGVTRSVKLYYPEVSFGNLTISGQVFTTPVNLSGHFTDYINTSNGSPSGTYFTQVITAAGSSIDFTSYNLFVFVIQGVTTDPPKLAWPWGGYSINIPTSHGTINARAVSMPLEWGMNVTSGGSTSVYGGGRTYYQTVTHEMGHTLDLPDEYHTPPAGRTDIAGSPNGDSTWDPMEFEGYWPHFTIAHLLMLGWVQPAWMKLYNFLSLGSSIDETISLSPVELGAPPAGKFAGVEVRIADGQNYYFEYRIGEIPQIGDRSLSPNGVVVGTEVLSGRDPDILLLPSTTDGSKSVMVAGDHYHEVDTSSPTYPADFQVDVVSISGTEAVLRIRYGVLGKPDPMIRPWPAGPDRQWQSPDIEVRNARTMADPGTWFNVPWIGHPNTIVATITNRGTVSAPGVVADFFYKDFTLSGAPETFVGTDTHDIGIGSSMPFTTPWNPPAPSDPSQPYHYCVIVRIHPYSTLGVAEISTSNNEAQSNYTRFISASASPASREIIDVTAANPYNKAVIFYIRSGQTNPFYRTYLEHYQLPLGPKESKKVRVMFEYAPDGPINDKAVSPNEVERYQKIPNDVGLVGYIMDPEALDHPHDPGLVGGAQVVILTGRATKFDRFVVDGQGAAGRVVTKSDGKGVPSGMVLVIQHYGKDEKYSQASIGSDGNFRTEVGVGWDSVEAYYVPPAGYGDCSSNLIKH